jgi:NAD-dependent dihydropyrimidine dehydrogenase PreA subunit
MVQEEKKSKKSKKKVKSEGAAEDGKKRKRSEVKRYEHCHVCVSCVRVCGDGVGACACMFVVYILRM